MAISKNRVKSKFPSSTSLI